jgi:hypothetical protein
MLGLFFCSLTSRPVEKRTGDTTFSFWTFLIEKRGMINALENLAFGVMQVFCVLLNARLIANVFLS